MQADRPLASVIVPTYRRPRPLARCLAALASQTCAHVETVVVHDGEASEDVEAVRRAVSTACPDARVLAQPHAGPAGARNAGAAAARGDLLLFTDDDCEPDPRWVETLVDASAAAPGCLIGGAVVNRLTDDMYASASQLLVGYLYEYYNRDVANARFFTSNNLAIPRDVFAALGGFDVRFRLTAGEDRDLCDRARHRGVRLVFDPRAVVGHAHAMTLRTFVRQHRNYGRGAALFHRLRAEREHARVRVEPVRFYTGILTAPIGRVPPSRVPWTMALMAASQIANAAGFLTASRSS